MRRIFVAALAVSLLVSSTQAAAITGGQPDNGAHPQVGLVVFLDASGTPLFRCSGTLLSATLFLTAGHCTAPSGAGVPATAQIFFADNVPFGTWTGVGPCGSATGYPCQGDVSGVPHPHPDFGFQNFPNTHDVGVVTLDKKVRGVTYATLAPLGFLDTFASQRGQQEINLTAVGYGLQEVKPDVIALRTRFAASNQIVQLNSALTDGFNVRTTASAGNGLGDGFTAPGGTCFGDSGGPVFYAQTLMIVGITSFGLNQNCKGGDYAFRADISETQDFVNTFR